MNILLQCVRLFWTACVNLEDWVRYWCGGDEQLVVVSGVSVCSLLWVMWCYI